MAEGLAGMKEMTGTLAGIGEVMAEGRLEGDWPQLLHNCMRMGHL